MSSYTRETKEKTREIRQTKKASEAFNARKAIIRLEILETVDSQVKFY